MVYAYKDYLAIIPPWPYPHFIGDRGDEDIALASSEPDSMCMIVRP